MGSSPLSRGIPPVALECGGFVRIIPALAGNTPSVLENSSYLPDHPRSRGEYSEFLDGHCGVVGSSPLSRGIPLIASTISVPSRIIPALAGNTTPMVMLLSKGRDHPRSRGEYRSALPEARIPPGSSPLSRGILEWFGAFVKAGRIIPALAGNTNCHCSAKSIVSDHPRSRGEYRHRRQHSPPGCGSSPLSRGIPTLVGQLIGFDRIIPALAGNTGVAAR